MGAVLCKRVNKSRPGIVVIGNGLLATGPIFTIKWRRYTAFCRCEVRQICGDRGAQVEILVNDEETSSHEEDVQSSERRDNTQSDNDTPLEEPPVGFPALEFCVVHGARSRAGSVLSLVEK